MSARRSFTSEAAPRRKTTLFCSSCGHESDVSGDWTVRTANGRHIYHCPVCNTAITKRRQGATLTVSSD